MIRIAIPHAHELVPRGTTIMRLVARTMVYALLTICLAGTQMARADCYPPDVPTIDSRLLTSAALRWSETGDSYRIPGRVEASADRTVENNFILNRLGIMYARGRGVPKSSRLATKLFRQLAMDGYTPAMVNLGTIYEWDVAGRRDHRQAYAWIRAALVLGVPKADYDTTLFKLGLIAVRLGATRTTSAERLALKIVDRIAERCEPSQRFQDTVTLGSMP